MAGNKTGPVHRGEEGFWLHGRWHQYLKLLDDSEREMPFTVPDEDMRTHSRTCRCTPCKAPHVQEMKAARERKVYSLLFAD